jgi:hypothetical protein
VVVLVVGVWAVAAAEEEEAELDGARVVVEQDAD